MAKGKVTKQDLFRVLISGFNGVDCHLPVPDERVLVYSPAADVRLPVKVDDDGVCRILRMDALAQTIERYTVHQLGDEFEITANQAREVAASWLGRTNVYEDEIKMLAQKTENVLCFHRLPWDLEEGPTPMWDELLARMNNVEAFELFIGSLFDLDSPNQQYLWLHSDGRNGKGTILRFLAKILGNTLASKTPPTNSAAHWTSGLEGKRLVAFPDVNGGGYVRSGHFKMMCGDDPIEINPKNQPSYTVYLNCKYMFLSNNLPEVGPLSADRARAIICTLGPVERKGSCRDFEQRLYDEGRFFLNRCLKRWQAYGQDFIEVNEETLDDASEWLSNESELFWQTHFLKAPGQTTKTSVVQNLMKREGITNVKAGDYYRWLKINHKIDRRVTRVGDRTEKHLAGIGLRTTPAVTELQRESGWSRMVVVRNELEE